MPSFFLSETLKYLYLTFDFDNPFRQNRRTMCSPSEAHIFPLHLRGAHPQEAMRDLSLKQRAKTALSVPQTGLRWNLKCPKIPWWGKPLRSSYLSHVGANSLAVQRTGGGAGVAKASSARKARLNGDGASNIGTNNGDMVLFNVDGVGEFEVTPFGGGFSVLNRLDGTFMEISILV